MISATFGYENDPSQLKANDGPAASVLQHQLLELVFLGEGLTDPFERPIARGNEMRERLSLYG
jgi:hypothetical protein